MEDGPSLRDDILAAFERACRERDFELAELLMQALEAMARRDGNDLLPEHCFASLLDLLLLPARH